MERKVYFAELGHFSSSSYNVQRGMQAGRLSRMGIPLASMTAAGKVNVTTLSLPRNNHRIKGILLSRANAMLLHCSRSEDGTLR